MPFLQPCLEFTFQKLTEILVTTLCTRHINYQVQCTNIQDGGNCQLFTQDKKVKPDHLSCSEINIDTVKMQNLKLYKSSKYVNTLGFEIDPLSVIPKVEIIKKL